MPGVHDSVEIDLFWAIRYLNQLNLWTTNNLRAEDFQFQLGADRIRRSKGTVNPNIVEGDTPSAQRERERKR